jgi:hypothetical protein
MNRRKFLLTTAAGFILPSFFDKAFSFVEQFGEPFIVKPNIISNELVARVDEFDGYELYVGNPDASPPPMTRRQYAERYLFGGIEAWIEEMEEQEYDLDEEMDIWDTVDAWCLADSPNARAYRLLEKLDLGPNFDSPDAVGEVQFFDCPTIGSTYRGVKAGDLVSVSLLQERLNQLNTGIHVRVWGES